MQFDKFVKKHTRALFTFILVAMAIPLVINFAPGGGCDAPGESGDQAGTIFGTIPVSRAEHQEARLTAFAYSRWKSISSGPMAGMRGQLIQYLMKPGSRWNDPKPEELDSLAWERIILRHYSADCGILTSKDEAREEIKETCRSAQINPGDIERYAGFVRNVFQCNYPEFERMVQDAIAIDKYLDLELEGPAVAYTDVYARLLKEERKYRVQVASFNPEDFQKELVMPGPDEVLKHFESNKSKYQVPAKCQLEYLMADVEKLKSAAPDPTEEDLKKYYEDNKDQFAKTSRTPPPGHDDDDGHDHDQPQKEYKTFEEVRPEIVTKVKTRDAEKAAAEAMKKVNTELGAEISRRKKEIAEQVGKDPAFAGKAEAEKNAETTKRFREASGDLLQKLREKYAAEAGGLGHDITVLFSAKQMEDVEKTVGRASGAFNLKTWTFETAAVGDFVPSVVKTDKGTLLFRLSRKQEPYTPDLSEPVRRQIAKEIAKGRLKDRAKKAAKDLVNKVLASTNRLSAFAELRSSNPGQFRTTRYFGSNDSGDLGLDDHSLGSAVKNAVTGQADSIAPGHAMEVTGPSGGEKKEWAFAAVVEDVVAMPSEDLQSKFSAEREEAERAELTKRRDQKIQEIRNLASLQDGTKAKPGTAGTP